MEKIFIRDFTPNQTISTTFLVKSKELRNKKTGGQFALITLSDKTGDIVGQWWDNFEESIDTFDRDDIVFARAMVTIYRNHHQLSIHRMRPCQEHEYNLTDYFPTTKYNVDEMFGELMDIIGEFKNEHLRGLLQNIFADENTARKFKKAPAAKTMHHPYLGGLLEHSLSLVKLCRKVGEHYQGIDVDLLQTGAVLHDFGKIDELGYERAFGYTNDGQMIGHLVMETIMVADHIKEIPDFPDDLRRHLLHLLLTHHGKLEYGSPKLPSTPEALMLAYLDDLDSKVEAMMRLISEPQIDGDWTRISPMFERPIYRRRTIETSTPAETGADENQAKAATAVSAQAEKSGHAQRKHTGRPDSFNTPFEQLSDLFKVPDEK
ncbi:MAG TPA: HD domain-containing protein [Blastocatellia bacterium]|nr:HD domain-containing protein [Blastocatellia bacterium]